MKSKSSVSTTIDNPSLIYYLETRFNFEAELLTPNTFFPGVSKNISTSPTSSIAPSPSTTSPSAWEYLFEEFHKSHTPENLIKFEGELRSRQAPGLEYSDATSFIYDAILLISQFYEKDVGLLNAILNLVNELTHHSRAKKYFPYIIVPRNVLLALSFAVTASVDKGLSATFFALAMQVITSFDSSCLPVKLVYSLFLPKESFGGYFPHKLITSINASRYVSCPIDSHPFSSFQISSNDNFGNDDEYDEEYDEENKVDCDMNSDSSYISHLRRCLWLMTILNANKAKKESSESQELWDSVMAEAGFMSNKPGFKFASLYECIPKYVSILSFMYLLSDPILEFFLLVGSSETDCIINQLKMNSHRPISIYEITAMYLEIFRIHPEVYYEMIKTAEFVKWIPDAILNFSPIMSLKNLPYQSANPRIRARTDVLFNGGAILPYSSSIAPSLTSTTFFEAVESQSCLDENETKHLSHEQGNILPVSTPSNLNRMDSTKSTATHMTVASEATITLANSKDCTSVKSCFEEPSSASSMFSEKSKRSMVLDVVPDDDEESQVNLGNDSMSTEVIERPDDTIEIQCEALTASNNPIPISSSTAEILDTSNSNVTLVGSNNAKVICVDEKQKAFIEKNEKKDYRNKKRNGINESGSDTKEQNDGKKDSNLSLNEFRAYLKAPLKDAKKNHHTKEHNFCEQNPTKESQRRPRHHHRSGGKSTRSKSKPGKTREALENASFLEDLNQNQTTELDSSETQGLNSKSVLLEKNLVHSKKTELPKSPLESISITTKISHKDTTFSRSDSKATCSDQMNNGVLRHVPMGIVQVQLAPEIKKTSHRTAKGASSINFASDIVLIPQKINFSGIVVEPESAEIGNFKDSSLESISEGNCSSSSTKLERTTSRASKDEEMVLKGEEMAQIASVIERLESADGSIGSSDKEVVQPTDGDGESFHSTQFQESSSSANLEKTGKDQKQISGKFEFDKCEKLLKAKIVEKEINKAYRKTLESGESLLRTSNKAQRTLSERLTQSHISNKYMAYKRVFPDDEIQEMQEDMMKKNMLKEK